MTYSPAISVHYLTNLDKAHLFLSLYLTNTLLGRLTQWGDLHFKSNSFSLKLNSVVRFCVIFLPFIWYCQKLFTESPIGTANFAYKRLTFKLSLCLQGLNFSLPIYLHLEVFHAGICISGIFGFMSEEEGFMRYCTRSQFFPAKLLLCSTLLLLGSESFTPASRFTWLGWLINCTFICRHLQEYYGSS